MSPHGALPQELVDQVIDELGHAYQDSDHDKRSDRRLGACKALHTCVLTSKNWTGRSRAHLFREVKIRGDEEGSFPMPPDSLMPYIEKLKIQLESQYYRLFPSPDLLTPFHKAPITYFGITGGALADARVCLVECIVALSATLEMVTFKSSSLSLHLILDILLGHPGLKRLHLLCCNFRSGNLGRPIAPHPGMCLQNLGLSVFSRPALGEHHLAVVVVAQLPNQFCRLDLDHVHSQDAPNATNALIKASAESLSSLQVRIVSLGSSWLGNQPLFSLGGCFNLSELSLDMESTKLCIVTTSTGILSTLDPTQRNRLEWIRLTTSCAYLWLREESRTELARAWKDLDAILSGVATKRRGRRLIFVLVSAGGHKEGCISFGRRWLPELLPRFRELGSLRLDFGRSRPNPVPKKDRILHHQQGCTKED